MVSIYQPALINPAKTISISPHPDGAGELLKEDLSGKTSQGGPSRRILQEDPPGGPSRRTPRRAVRGAVRGAVWSCASKRELPGYNLGMPLGKILEP